MYKKPSIHYILSCFNQTETSFIQGWITSRPKWATQVVLRHLCLFNLINLLPKKEMNKNPNPLMISTSDKSILKLFSGWNELLTSSGFILTRIQCNKSWNSTRVSIKAITLTVRGEGMRRRSDASWALAPRLRHSPPSAIMFFLCYSLSPFFFQLESIDLTELPAIMWFL